MGTVDLNVPGMHCDGCEESIKRALSRIEGVREVAADHRTGKVSVTAEPVPARTVLVSAVEDAGYDVLPDQARPLPMA